MRRRISVLRLKVKLILDLATDERLRRTILHALPFWFASLLTGLVAVGYTKLFSLSEGLMYSIFKWNAGILFLMTPLCFFSAWWIVQRWAPNARGSGIPQVMASIQLSGPKYIHLLDRLLSLRIVFIKIISSLLMVLGGGAIGREGPTIQIAGSLFRLTNKWLPKSWPRLSAQSFILTGAAAGLAAAFNTPLGGIVFAVEELSKIHISYFRTALFSAVIIAGLTAQGLLGPYLYLGYPDISNPHLSIFFGVTITALIAGICGGFLSKLILMGMAWKRKLTTIKQIFIFLILGGLVVATFAFFINDRILGSGKDIMNTVLFTSAKFEKWHTVFLRMIGSIIAFTTGAAGGVFAPSLAAGASIGSFISGLFHVAGTNANILILAGMVGFLTGVTRSPFTSAILVLEMTDRHRIIFHLMLAALIANVAALIIDKHSLYDHLKEEYLSELKNEGPEPILDEQKKPDSSNQL